MERKLLHKMVELQAEELKTLKERELLRKTVELQAEELKELKELTFARDNSKQVQALKMQLLEQDLELATLKAELEDTQGGEDEDDGDITVNQTTWKSL